MSDRDTAQIISKTNTGDLVVRLFKIDRRITKKNEWYSIREAARFFVRADKFALDCYYNEYGKERITSWRNGTRPRYKMYAYNFEGDAYGILYTENLSEVLQGTPWQYSQIEQYAEQHEYFIAAHYLRQYARYPQMEYLMKLGFYKLVYQLVASMDNSPFPYHLRLNKKSPEKMLGVPKRSVSTLAQLNVDNATLKLCQILAQNGREDDMEDMVLFCREKSISDFADLATVFHYVSPQKWQKYITEQVEQKIATETREWVVRSIYSNTSTLYKDYLAMCERLPLDLKNSFVLFPKNLKARHDELVSVLEIKAREADNRKIEGAYRTQQKKYAWQSGGLMILPPRNADDIIREGSNLHHCVGTYVSKVADGRSVILFVRRLSNPKKSYYTIEYSDNKVVQLKGFGNQDPPENVSNFVDKWQESIMKRAA